MNSSVKRDISPSTSSGFTNFVNSSPKMFNKSFALILALMRCELFLSSSPTLSSCVFQRCKLHAKTPEGQLSGWTSTSGLPRQICTSLIREVNHYEHFFSLRCVHEADVFYGLAPNPVAHLPCKSHFLYSSTPSFVCSFLSFIFFLSFFLPRPSSASSFLLGQALLRPSFL